MPESCPPVRGMGELPTPQLAAADEGGRALTYPRLRLRSTRPQDASGQGRTHRPQRRRSPSRPHHRRHRLPRHTRTRTRRATFTLPAGDYTYWCTLHPSMSGRLHVTYPPQRSRRPTAPVRTSQGSREAEAIAISRTTHAGAAYLCRARLLLPRGCFVLFFWPGLNAASTAAGVKGSARRDLRP